MRGLAGAIAPGEEHALARLAFEAEASQDVAVATPEMQASNLQHVSLVPRAGIEPAWPRGRRILSPLRLPVPPPGLPVLARECSPSLGRAF